MEKIKVRTLWDDMAWVADHILNKAQKEKKGLILKYKDKTMTILPELLDAGFWRKGQEIYQDKFSRKPYRLYGIKFVADNQQKSLFV